MASGLFFNPIRLLRLAPLISSTGSLVHATAELEYNSSFTDPRIRKNSNEFLPKWYEKLFYRAVWVVVALNTVTTWSATANLLLGGERTLMPAISRKLYMAGLAGAIGHLLFVPLVAPPIQKMIEDRGETGAADEMAKWVRIHKIRMLVADIPAWICFLGAVLTCSPL